MTERTNCSICRSPGTFLREHTVMGGRFDATYLRCKSCDFVWVSDATWLDVAYDDAIVSTDTGVLARTDEYSEKLAVLLAHQRSRKGRYLDIGGGYGLLVRSMRDRGFDFRWADPFAPNLFARGYEDDGGGYDAVTAFEVIEHSPDPLSLAQRALSRTGARMMVFSTQLWRDRRARQEVPAADWWYFSYETGQHISFFAHRTVQRLGKELGLNAYSVGGLHVLSAEALSERLLSIRLRAPIRSLLARKARAARESLTEPDHHERVRALQQARRDV